ncbi:hypothetical protein [Brevibacterium epidermidis]|uniref:hypothetical protein n=1 Tax=Brevibacterium epidermidis TaxID=1698 RepID=UPI001F538B27|nr:hypothetical protein [Brevibacterium epidermidis]
MSTAAPGPSAKTSTSTTETWALSATEALAAFRSKELSPVDYLEALIGRITAEDERINAVTEVVEEAVTSAREAETFYTNATDDDLAEAADASRAPVPDVRCSDFP